MLLLLKSIFHALLVFLMHSLQDINKHNIFHGEKALLRTLYFCGRIAGLKIGR